MFSIDMAAMTKFVVEMTGADQMVVETAWAFQHEYEYGLGLRDGPEPPWLWYEPEDLAGSPPIFETAAIAGHMAQSLDLPPERHLLLAIDVHGALWGC
jgi:hypothetical protein